MNRTFFCAIILAFSLAIPCPAKTIIFDIFGVLFYIPTFRQVSFMGWDPLGYFLLDFKNPAHISSLFLDILFHVPVKAPLIHTYKNSNKGACSFDKPMAPINFLWQARHITWQEALKATLDHIEQLDKKGFFCSNREKNIIINAAYISFDLETRKSMFAPIKSGVKLLTRCAKQTDISGKKSNTLYILSNMDKEMMDYLIAQYPEIFSLCDGIIISSDTQTLKPDTAIFQALLDKYKLQPRECIFIDDQQENIAAAQSLGLEGILCDSLQNVAKKLEQKSVIAIKRRYA